MNLLEYTKKIAEKIKLYDAMAKNPFAVNPFDAHTPPLIIFINFLLYSISPFVWSSPSSMFMF